LVEAHFGRVVLAEDEVDELVSGAWLLYFFDCVVNVHHGTVKATAVEETVKDWSLSPSPRSACVLLVLIMTHL